MEQIGRSVRRVEDDRLLRGQGRFLADIRLPGALETVFLRSAQAHAAIRRIEVSAARAVPGVVAVFTAADVVERTQPLCMSDEVRVPEQLQRELNLFNRRHPLPLLPSLKVSYAGQAVAMIIAESSYAAMDAAELIEVKYEPLATVFDPVAAIATDAPLVEPSWSSNVAFSVSASKGDPDVAFAAPFIVVEEQFRSHRYVASPLEPRGVQAAVEPVSGSLTVWASTQIPHVLLNLLAATLGLADDRIRVIACDVGGGFGQKAIAYVEDVLVAFAALRLNRPVRWIEERGENLISASHARAQNHRISVAASKDGRILAVRDDVLVDFGAFNVLGLVVPYNTLSHLLGPYDVENAAITVKGVLTNTCPTAPYRGAGRPEAVFAMERIIDRLAAKLALDPGELRIRNLISAAAMPHHTEFLYSDGRKQVYDSGDFPQLLRRAKSKIDLDGIRARQQNGTLVGVGFALYVEGTGSGPFEGAVVRILPSGRVQVATGACSQGQGHRTAYAQIAADALGVPIETIDVIGGDTGMVPFGIGTYGSRSTVTAGSAIYLASTKVRKRALGLAEHLLEASASDLELVDGKVRVRGVPQYAITLSAIARAAAQAVLREGASGDGLLAETEYFIPPTVTYASAAHAAVVRVDQATGEVAVERYVVVHDCGRVVNPMLAEGQITGGVAQGVGGALCEEFVYDKDGQPLTGSFMDYALPIASSVPSMVFDHIESLSPRNPLGVKGLGEGGAIGAPAAIANAVEDALRLLAIVVRHGPLTPSRVRALIATSKRERA
jgi:aerobic carbon-monoxide dehydrogenase large subunit